MDPEKQFVSHEESAFSAKVDDSIDRSESRFVDNYHGISLKTVLVYLALCLVYFAQLFTIVGSGALARNIAAAIGGSENTVWLSQAIVIVTCVLGPPVSQAADYWGRKWFLSGGCACGFVGAIIVSRANSFGQVIGGQVVLSVNYIAQPLLVAVGSEILPRKYRPSAQAGLNLAGALGGIVGLLGGANLMDKSLNGWRNYWYIIAALLGTSSILVAVAYKPPARPAQRALSNNEKLKKLDWVAYLLLASGLTLFTMGLTWGNNPYPWSSSRVLATVVVGGVIMIILVLHQTFVKKDGLIHHDLFKHDRNFALALGCFFVDGMVFWAANNYYSFQVSILYEENALLTSLHYSVAFISASVAAGSVTIIQVISKSKIREPIVVSFLLFTVFFALMATTTLGSATAVWGYPVILGVGLGWSLTYLVAVAQLSTAPSMIAITSGLMLSIRSFGGSIGLAVYTAIFNSNISRKLGSGIAAAVLPLGLPPNELEQFIGALAAHNEAAIAKIPGVTPAMIGAGVNALQKAYLHSFRPVWIAAAVFSGVTAIASCFIKNPSQDLNNHVDAPLDG